MGKEFPSLPQAPSRSLMRLLETLGGQPLAPPLLAAELIRFRIEGDGDKGYLDGLGRRLLGAFSETPEHGESSSGKTTTTSELHLGGWLAQISPLFDPKAAPILDISQMLFGLALTEDRIFEEFQTHAAFEPLVRAIFKGIDGADQSGDHDSP